MNFIFFLCAGLMLFMTVVMFLLALYGLQFIVAFDKLKRKANLVDNSYSNEYSQIRFFLCVPFCAGGSLGRILDGIEARDEITLKAKNECLRIYGHLSKYAACFTGAMQAFLALFVCMVALALMESR